MAKRPASRVAAKRPSDPKAPTQADAEAAIRTLIRWAGDDPMREGLLDTPSSRRPRLSRILQWLWRPGSATVLARTFEETDGYDEMIVLRDMRFESHCEHHMAPIIGRAHIAYLPRKRVVGISKLARLLDVYAKRLQIQEKLTAQIANTLNDVFAAARRCRGDRRQPSMHDNQGRPQARHPMVTNRIFAFRTDPSDPARIPGFIGLPPATVGSSS